MRAESKGLRTGDKLRLIGPVVLYAAIAFVAWKRGYFNAQNLELAAERSTGTLWIGAGFIVVYAALSTLALPASPFAFGAGAVFGFWRASVLVWIASMLGAVAGYYLARGVLAKPARRLLGRYQDKLQHVRGEHAFGTGIRMRLVPMVPFGAFTYAAAISRLDPLPFFAGSAIGIVPSTLLATFVGDRFAAGFHGESKRPYLFAAAAALLLVGISFVPALWGKFRKHGRG